MGIKSNWLSNFDLGFNLPGMCLIRNIIRKQKVIDIQSKIQNIFVKKKRKKKIRKEKNFLVNKCVFFFTYKTFYNTLHQSAQKLLKCLNFSRWCLNFNLMLRLLLSMNFKDINEIIMFLLCAV